VAIVERLRREFPARDLTLVVSDRLIGSNRKVSNLANLGRRAKYEVLLIADSDIRVGPGYLRAVVDGLRDRSVGLVTCLYRAAAARTLASRLGAMSINEWFLPSAVVAARLERIRFACGATIACRRTTLAAVGGFAAVADYLADDYMLACLVEREGLRVVVSPYVVTTVVAEADLPSLFFHELRWARTIRIARPLAYFGSLVTHGVVLSALFALSTGPSGLGLAGLVAHLGLRCGGRLVLSGALEVPATWRESWAVLLRDVLSFAIWALSFLGRRVRWKDQRLSVGSDGKIRCPRLSAPAAVRAVHHPPAVPAGPYLRTLLLHPPSWEGFDGGAGARYQARREVRSFWYPTWLAQPAALVPGSRLVDAPPAGLTLEDVRPLGRQYELAVLHTSTPSFPQDVKVAEALKAENPALRIGFVGAHVAADPERALRASEATEFVARREFDFTIQEIARGWPLGQVLGVSYRDNGIVQHTADRPLLEDMDALPFVTDVYQRDLTIEHYVIGYLRRDLVVQRQGQRRL
jgi:hopanoid biosynthesis associated glycosyl transferase protein HpnI